MGRGAGQTQAGAVARQQPSDSIVTVLASGQELKDSVQPQNPAELAKFYAVCWDFKDRGKEAESVLGSIVDIVRGREQWPEEGITWTSPSQVIKAWREDTYYKQTFPDDFEFDEVMNIEPNPEDLAQEQADDWAKFKGAGGAEQYAKDVENLNWRRKRCLEAESVLTEIENAGDEADIMAIIHKTYNPGYFGDED